VVIYIIIGIIALVLIEAVALIQLMISPIGGFLGTIIGPLTGAFAGVLLGFKINEDHRKKLDKERGEFLKSLLVHEIDKSIDILNKRENTIIPAIIPVSGWDSLINSGDIPLFTPDQSIQISDIILKFGDTITSLKESQKR
jgi:hypothetical protein